MGVDIHPLFHRQTPKGWVEIEHEYEGPRDRILFAVLAGVSDRSGIEPIAERRGFPEDLSREDDWGDYGQTWYLGQELLDWYKNATELREYGILSSDMYKDWIKDTHPVVFVNSPDAETYVGKTVVTQERAEAGDAFTYVRVSWPIDVKESLGYFFNEVQRLQDIYGVIRFVFSFDG